MHKDDVNRLALMAYAGIDEEEAATRLATTVCITAGDNEGARRLAHHLGRLLERTLKLAASGSADVHVSIESDAAIEASARIFVRIDQDAVYLSTTEPSGTTSTEGVTHDLILKIAACYLAGFTVGQALGRDIAATVPSEFRISARDFNIAAPDLHRKLRLENAALVGAGGVANGFLWGLESLQVSGELNLCDPKLVSDTNLNRCIFFADADVGQPKSEVLARNASILGLALKSYVGEFHDFVERHGSVRRVFSTPDSRRARRNIRDELALEILDASTTDISEVVVFSERQPTELACLACIYPASRDEHSRERNIAETLGLSLDEVQAQFISEATAAKLAVTFPDLDPRVLVNTSVDSLFRAQCGAGMLATAAGPQTLAPLGFISNLAGLLLALELVRFELGVDGTNYSALSPWRPPHKHARRLKRASESCPFCGREDVMALLLSKWGEASGGS